MLRSMGHRRADCPPTRRLAAHCLLSASNTPSFNHRGACAIASAHNRIASLPLAPCTCPALPWHSRQRQRKRPQWMSSTCGVRCNGVGVPKKVERWSGQGRKSEGTDVKDTGATKNKREQEKERPRTRENDKETEEYTDTVIKKRDKERHSETGPHETCMWVVSCKSHDVISAISHRAVLGPPAAEHERQLLAPGDVDVDEWGELHGCLVQDGTQTAHGLVRRRCAATN